MSAPEGTPAASGSDLVVCSLESWDEVWRRNQFLVAGLLERDPGLRVLFVEPPADPIYELRSGRRPHLGAGLRRISHVSSRLFALQLTKWLPRLVGPTSDQLLRRGLRRVTAKLGMASPVLWVNDPSWAELTRVTGWPALYDITDDWLLAQRGERERARIQANEALLMERCREVVVCSPSLAASKGELRPVRLIPNAVDVARFRRPQPRPADLPTERVALYVGTLHEDRLDVELCVAVAERLAAVGATLALLGPNSLRPTNRERLQSQPGLWLAGARPNAVVPAYLQHATVLVVPHVVDEFTDSLDPIKLYEYLAVGRPVVSTPVAGFREAVRPGVRVVPAAEYVAAVVDAVQHPPPEVGPFDVPDWSDRVTAMAEVLAAMRS